MGPFREIRMKKTAPCGPIKDKKKPRHVDLLRTKKTAPAGLGAVLMGPFREIRTKKTAPRGSIKDKKDRATWIC